MGASITATLVEHFPSERAGGWGYCVCGFEFQTFEEWAQHALSEVGLNPQHEPSEAPDRKFTDDLGRRWEWCGGIEGTWAWRVTALT